MRPPALTFRQFSTDLGGAFPRLNGWRTRWEMGVGAAGHEDQAEQMRLVEGLFYPQRHGTPAHNIAVEPMPYSARLCLAPLSSRGSYLG
jgi:hypothetical protein